MPDPRFFNTKQTYTLGEIARLSGCLLNDESDAQVSVSSVAPIGTAGSGDITFLNNVKYIGKLSDSNARACILSEKHILKAPKGMALLIADDPYVAYAKTASLLHLDEKREHYISDKAYIADSAVIAKDCTINAGAYIGENAEIGSGTVIGVNSVIERGVVIGKNCRIQASVTISHAIIGNDCHIYTGVRIGQDGFGFATHNGKHISVPQLGTVIIEDDVEIGANSTIDRGAGPDTIIGTGTRIDNLVQIGHNVQIGRGCVIVSQVGISGSTKLGDYVVIGGQAGIAGHLNIESGANIAAKSGIMSDIGAGETLGGYPAIPIKQWHRQTIALKKLVQKKEESANE